MKKAGFGLLFSIKSTLRVGEISLRLMKSPAGMKSARRRWVDLFHPCEAWISSRSDFTRHSRISFKRNIGLSMTDRKPGTLTSNTGRSNRMYES
jgi:hypothetical protein